MADRKVELNGFAVRLSRLAQSWSGAHGRQLSREAAAVTAQPREAWADVARGIGIVLVVYGHALRGVATAGYGDGLPAVAAQDAAIYSFHMPLFFVVSGLFFRTAGAPRDFARRLAVGIVYPYLLWSLLHGALSLAATAEVNHPVSLKDMADIYFRPLGQFWFLYALALCQIAGFILKRPALILAAGVAGFLGVSIVGMHNILGQSAYYLLFFALGVVLAPARRGLTEAPAAHLAIAALVAAAAFATVFALQTQGAAVEDFPPPARLALALFGAGFVLAASAFIGERAPFLAALGRASLAIFVMHTIVSAGARIFMVRTGVEESLPQVAIATALGIAIPFLAFGLARRMNATAAVGFGR